MRASGESRLRPVRDFVLQTCRYGISGGLAAATHLAVLIALVEGLGVAETLASGMGLVCATPVNYLLQHRFVFRSGSHHAVAFPRYVGITLATLALNTGVFWFLVEVAGIFYVAGQVLTIGLVVPVNFALNLTVTFAGTAPAGR